MANKKKSRMEYFRKDIEKYLNIGVNIRNIWKIINAELPQHSKITYQGFYKYVKKNLNNYSWDNEENNL